MRTITEPTCLTEAHHTVADHERRPARSRSERSTRGDGERSFVLVWMALMLFMLLAVAGFSVDLGNWYLRSAELQNAVDAGAHAGAVFLPGNVPEAKIKARTETARNGYNDGILSGDVNANLTVTQLSNPYQLQVEGDTVVDNFFLSLIGMDTQELHRDAVGEFESPIAMGSPENKVGDDPEEGDVDSQFWVNIAGPKSTKVSGDRYQAKVCPTSVAKCTNTVNPGTQNDEYAFDGYFFALKVKTIDPGKDLILQVYDGEMAYVGDYCEKGKFPTAGELTALESLPGNPYPDASTRYLPGTSAAPGDWCTGDQEINGSWATETTFLLREPDDTPWSDTDNPVVDNAYCHPQKMPAYNATSSNFIYNNLSSGPESVIDDGDGVWTFAETFRRWATICVIPSGSVQTGDYLLQVRSNADADPETYDATVNDGGHNRMSFRVGFGTTGVADLNGANVSMAARSKLPIYANANGADTSFHLARVLPADAGRTLRVTLFDMGDAASEGTLRILAPAESPSTFEDCDFSRDNGGSLSVSSNCQLNQVSSAKGFNGRIVTVDIPIPTDYTCDDTIATGCWAKVLADFPGGVNDTTTWSAAILGSPVRLVE